GAVCGVYDGSMGHLVSFLGGPSGNLDAGVLELVAAVDGGEHGRDALQRPRVGQRSHVDGAQTDALTEFARDLLGLGVSATEKEVALNGVLGGRKLMGSDVVEGGDHSRLRSQ